MNIADILGFGTDKAKEIIEQRNEALKSEGGFELPEPGIYELVVKNVYITENKETGSKMLNATFELPPKNEAEKALGGQEFTISLWHTSGKTGKAGFDTKDGKFKESPGVEMILALADAEGIALDGLKPISAKVSHYGQDIEAVVIPQLENKKICAGIRHIKEEWNGNEKTKLDVVPFKCSDTELREKLAKRIEKRPVIDRTGGKEQKVEKPEIPQI